VATGDHTAQFDEQLRLIYASTKEDAFYKAQQTGKKEEEKFYNLKTGIGAMAIHQCK
jgi:hypothetical protein